MNCKYMKIIIFMKILLSINICLGSPSNSSLEGFWTQDCDAKKIKTQHFKNKNSTMIETFFSDSDCLLPQLSFINHGSFTTNGNEIDFIFEYVGVRLHNQIWVDRYNSQKVCQFHQWELNKTFVVSGKTCDYFAMGFEFTSPLKGDARYGIFKITDDDSNPSSLLFFGQTSFEKDGTSPEKRPLQFHLKPYQLQNKL